MSSTNILADEEKEFTRTKRDEEESIKNNLLGDKERIRERLDLDTLIVQQITTILFRFEMLLAQAETSTITRIKIYELLTMMLRLKCQDIDVEIATNQKIILQYLINDIEHFDSNSNVLSVLFNLVEVITTHPVDPLLPTTLYNEFNLLQTLTARLSLSEYSRRPNERKDIYAYIHNLVKVIQNLLERHQKGTL